MHAKTMRDPVTARPIAAVNASDDGPAIVATFAPMPT